MAANETESTEIQDGGELVYRASEPEQMRFRDDGGGALILEGRMIPYDEWTEVDSSIEGHFMERFAPGALAKTLRERATRIRALFEHGLDFLGRQPIATNFEFRDQDDGAYFQASLLRGVPDLLIEGLRAGQYGSSVRFRPIPGKWDRVRSPGQSEHNPEGIPEHTYREAYVHEFSVTAFPQYEGSTAALRSITDDIYSRQLGGGLDRLIELIRAAEPPATETTTKTTEPQHSQQEAEDPPEPEQRSRSTQPSRDYLRPEEEDKPWRL